MLCLVQEINTEARNTSLKTENFQTAANENKEAGLHSSNRERAEIPAQKV